ncbi:MAG TPA: M1 family aminopeptidase [Noviherbaspirillum sp.]|uniref:M1 family metallopeptidase n=1 Tax=Noviherbaspirillum sp. TaxID=1926288 RepID=UPI002D5F1285|nr:M1 family aminopeptidase [Noviherbaspirillum sp.]HYD94396.1 M1 family aminopeptidase [Noviherbaspirillum sp.]
MRAVPGLRVARLALAALLALASTLAAAAGAPRLDLQVELDPATRSLRARAELVPAESDFRFALHESLSVSAASAGGKSVKVTPAGRDGAIREWRVTVPAGAATLRLEYQGTLPALDRGLDHRGVLRAMPPMASPEGSFLPAGGAWYPQPAPLFAYKLDVTVPASQRAVAPGRLAAEQLPAGGGDRYRASFEFDQPADGIDLMAGPWVVRERTVPRAGAQPLRLRTYFTPELDATPELADAYLDDTRRYIELYSGQIGAYPFAGFSVVASPLPTGFGMPTLTYLGADVIRLPFIRATSLGHEVLHNWWGNGVYVDYASGNWSEGLTTFMADYAYKEQESADAAREMRLGWLRDFAAVPAGEHAPLAAFRSRTHGAAAAVGYGKSAMLFFMLRDLIGEQSFRQGIRAFWDSNRFRRAGWDDLREAFEQASGRPLKGFFSQWLGRAGGPAPVLKSARVARDAGAPRLLLELEQAAPPYALHLPIELVYPGRTETRWVDLARAQETLRIDAEPPTGVRLDPELRVWRVLERDQLPPILRQWYIASAAQVAFASDSPEVREAGAALAQRLFEAPPRNVPLDAALSAAAPVMLVGLHADVDAALARAGLAPRPANIAGKGSAQVWTVERQGMPVAVISAASADALRALMRPLPHYGAQSWLVFDGSRATGKGVWGARVKTVPVEQR